MPTAVLALADSVDRVVVFDDDESLSLIEWLLPTDLIKGAVYDEDQVVKANIVKTQGGRVHLIQLMPGLSTTPAIIRFRQGQDRAARVRIS